MKLKVTSLYTSIAILFLIGLTFFVISNRLHISKAIGYETGTQLERAVRSHGNFVEYTPIFLISLFIFEQLVKSSVLPYLLGAIFFLGRCSHFFSLNYYEVYHNSVIFRQIGMMSTILCFLILAISIFYFGFCKSKLLKK